MDSRDINTFIRAKKQEKREKITLIVAALSLASYWFLIIFGVELHPGVMYAAVFTLCFIFLSMFNRLSNSIVSQNELLDIIERAINNDPDALKYLIQSQKE